MKKLSIATLAILIIVAGAVVANRTKDADNSPALSDSETNSETVSDNSPLPAIPESKTIATGYHVFQTFNNCGPAALSMALSYFGIQKDQATLATEIRPYNNKSGINDNKSTPPPILAAKAEEYGLITYYRAGGTIERLQQLIANDIPVVVRTLLHHDDTIAHYRVIKGYDQATKKLIQDDSYQGKNLAYTYAEFEEIWKPFNNAYLVMVPKGKQAVVEKILGAELNETVAWQNAANTAKKMLEKNPNDTIARLNLSTASFYLGDYAKSVKEFETIESKLPLQMVWYQVEPIESYFNLRRFERVFEISDKIFASGNKAAVELYLLRAKSHQAFGDNQAAKIEFDKADMYSKAPTASSTN